MTSANVNLSVLSKRISKLEKKMDGGLNAIMAYLEDIIMTPEEYTRYADAQKAYSKREHKKWKSPKALLKELEGE